MQEIKNVRGGEPIHIDNLTPTKPLTEHKEEAHVPTTDINKVPQKKSVFLVFILSLITLNIYDSIWYMKRVLEFYNLGTQKKISNALPLTLIVINILLIVGILIFPVTITEDMGTFYQHLGSMQMGLLFGIGILALLKIFFTLLLAFHSRTVINQALENKNSQSRVSALFTLFFTNLYLQYEINRIIDDKEDTPRVGPWVFLLILIVIMGVSIAYPYFM